MGFCKVRIVKVGRPLWHEHGAEFSGVPPQLPLELLPEDGVDEDVAGRVQHD